MAMRRGRISAWTAVGAAAAIVGLCTSGARAQAAAAEDSAGGDPLARHEAVQFFETSVRPLLAANCYECHGPDKQKGGLRLDSRAAIVRGGEIGPAMVPGAPAESAIVRAVGYNDPDLRMPPKQRLSPAQVEVLTRWVAMGAPWPGGEDAEPGDAKPAAAAGAMRVTDADRAHWAFRPVADPATPPVRDATWVANPIDAFVLAKLEQAGLQPSPPAAPRELLRRASFDLTGLPPSPEEYAAFVSDRFADAWPRAVDRLLASPRYGERWARHWLDVVRYAQTNGYERDGEKPLAWRYRDYVIGAFNADRPYDQFVREQLAGDELDVVTDDSVIATGFYRLAVVDDEPDDAKTAEYDYHDDNLRTIGAAFLGLTVGCARCHDHKFDPIPQADYYRLLAFIHNVRPHERERYTKDSAVYVPLGQREAIDAWYAEKDAKLAPLRQQMEAIKAPVRQGLIDKRLAELPEPVRLAYLTDAAARTGEQQRLADEAAARVVPSDQDVINALQGPAAGEHGQLAQQVRELSGQKPPFEMAMAVREHGPVPAMTHVLVRGSAASPGARVVAGFPEVIGGVGPAAPIRPPRPESTGLRRALAEWLVRPDHPLTARVMVNRVWQHHFGRGIVQTVDDFGKTGTPPTHPELLDWLASRFVEDGWSVKQLHKLILTSNTYRMSSRASGNPAAAAADPGNALLWRQDMRRLEAEAIRDSVLAVCGTLNPQAGGRGFFPRLSREAIASGSRPGDGWDVSTAAERNRRSIYVYLKRSQLLPMLEMFDFNNTAMPSGERASTIVSPQALMLLNDDFVHEQADALARRLMGDAPDRGGRVTRAYALALGRAPTAAELEVALGYVDRQARAFAASARQMTFRPQVPSALDERYLAKLGDGDLLSGPAQGWRYGRGAWGGSYEYIVNVDAARGPFALAETSTFADGTLTARLRLHAGAEVGGLILRGGTSGDATASHTGYDVVLDAREQAIALRRHTPDKVTVLSSAPLAVRPQQWYALRVAASGPRLRVWLDGSAEPVLDATDAEPITAAGHPGVRVWGASMDVDGLTVESAGATTVLAEGVGEAGRAERQALASFCLVLLNLNEFVYVD
jgi:hypothetical protein